MARIVKIEYESLLPAVLAHRQLLSHDAVPALLVVVFLLYLLFWQFVDS